MAEQRAVRDLGDVFAAESTRLWRAVFAFAQDRAVTDDAVAEAFAQCLRRGDAVKDRRAWVWKAAFRLAAGDLAARRRTSAIDDVPEPTDTGDVGPVLVALASLPGNQRAAAILHWYAGYATGEIADILGVSSATVRVHLSRGRKRLRGLLGEGDST